ncbi:carbohydrate ABC transporter permease [Paenibacillus spongiae]|uniref:Carbohydrate ABC transporter permease n=1 Tax=Paenibacillus spongiae TaxID=2909671 RepID=A0ABY5S1D7_9BACL|nr:carbohydrate ABC transporter permease [Paenibacillus spongiae]UVI27365.1 carbohydrate ABC transporter permease [Paenibacillus spongiae]
MRKSMGVSGYAFDAINYALLALLGIATLYPFLNLMAISFNHPMDTIRGQVYLWPNEFTWSNYLIVFENDGLLGAAGRSVARTLLGTFLSVTCTTMLAFTLSRKEYVLRKSINYVLIVSMYVSGGIIPGYMLIKNLGLLNSFWVYIIPGLIGVYNVIIIRSYFDSMPEGLMESAKIDGASDFQLFSKIALPTSLPVLATITLFVSVGHWNAWFDNYLYNTKPNLSLLQYELMKILIQSTSQVTSNATGYVDKETLRQTTPQSIRATMTVIVTLPILFVYPFMQRYFIKGIMVGSIKE